MHTMYVHEEYVPNMFGFVCVYTQIHGKQYSVSLD